MRRRLPPLTSLRAFEAAGRHLSFTNAADELTVTQAAVSHQVKALEDYLGVALFARLHRKLELTESGAALLPVLQSALDSISDSVAEIQDTDVARLSIVVAPSFAANWLLPRLDGWRRQHPELELSLRHSNAPINFATDNVDVGISFGNGKWRGLKAEPILQLDFYPVCSPSLLSGSSTLESVNDLSNFALLHDADHGNWRDWLALAGSNSVDSGRGTVLDDTNVLIQAALDGLGIAMGSTSFIQDHLDSGRLVRPFDTTLFPENAYYAVCPRENLKRPGVSLFWTWLLEQREIDV